jgi:hypothetical protein
MINRQHGLGVLAARVNKRGNRLRAAALCAAIATSGAALAAESPATQPADISQELSALRARIDQLERQQDQQHLMQTRHEQKTAVPIVPAGTDRPREPLNSIGITAGYKDHRFYIASDDGRFVFRPWLHIQFRDATLWRQDFKGPGKDETDNGFEMRRMRFGVDGNLFGTDLQYLFNWATNRANGTSSVTNAAGAKIGTVSNSLGGVPLLEEAWIKYRFHGTPFYVWAGQIKDPVEHDQIVSSRYQHGIERSLIGDIFFNGDAFTEGATLIYDPGTDIRAQAGVNHGMRSANTNFFDYPTQNAFDYGVVGRVEYKFFGRWADYGQIGAIEVKQPLLVAGLGTDYSERGHSGQTVSAADLTYADPGGLSLFGAFASRYTTHNFGIYTQSPVGASISAPSAAVLNRATDEYGLMAEVGYVFNNFIEPYGRIEYMHLQGTVASSNSWIQAYTGGVNFYFEGNRVKLTPEVMYLPRGIPIDDGPSDIFASPHGRAEIMAEIQLQVLL